MTESHEPVYPSSIGSLLVSVETDVVDDSSAVNFAPLSVITVIDLQYMEAAAAVLVHHPRCRSLTS